jgi:hypothetical protein
MDKYDYLILDIIREHKGTSAEPIKLIHLEKEFWRIIEHDRSLTIGDARIGERITLLFLEGYIQLKDGYSLTKRGREELSYQVR